MAEQDAVPEFMKSAEQKEDENLFNPDNAVKAAWVKFGKVGDWFSGTLIGKRTMKSTMPGKEGEIVNLYEFKASGGSFHRLDPDKVVIEPAVICNPGEVWTIGGKKSIDDGMRNVKLGQKVGLKFTEKKPSKTPGFAAAHVIKVFTSGQMDPDWMGEDAADMMPGIKRPGA